MLLYHLNRLPYYDQFSNVSSNCMVLYMFGGILGIEKLFAVFCVVLFYVVAKLKTKQISVGICYIWTEKNKKKWMNFCQLFVADHCSWNYVKLVKTYFFVNLIKKFLQFIHHLIRRIDGWTESVQKYLKVIIFPNNIIKVKFQRINLLAGTAFIFLEFFYRTCCSEIYSFRFIESKIKSRVINTW